MMVPDAVPARRAPREIPRSLLALLATFFLLSAFWAVVIPVPAAGPDALTWDGYNPDEQSHMAYIAFVATEHRLPLPWLGTEASIHQLYTGVHPPFYYLLGALLYGVGAPLVGYAKMLVILRLVGSAIGASVVFVTYRTAARLLPHDTALLAAAFVAGVPMFVSLSGAVTNEVFATLMAAIALMTMVDILLDGLDRRRALALALWVTAGIGAKVTNFALAPAAVLTILLAPVSDDARGDARRRSLLTLLIVPAIGIGWWFVRNQLVYGDPLQSRQHSAFWSQTIQSVWWTFMTTGEFLRNVAIGGWASFWGIFDAFSRPMPAHAYYLIAFVQGASVFGLAYLVARRGLAEKKLRDVAAVFALFAVLIVVVFYLVNWRMFSPQGRYLFPLLLPIGIATAVGWTAFWAPRWRRIPILAAVILLVALNLYVLLVMPRRIALDA